MVYQLVVFLHWYRSTSLAWGLFVCSHGVYSVASEPPRSDKLYCDIGLFLRRVFFRLIISLNIPSTANITKLVKSLDSQFQTSQEQTCPVMKNACLVFIRVELSLPLAQKQPRRQS
jgi:hypothetical protein